MRLVLLLLTGLLSAAVQAAPLEVATFDRRYWPEQLDTPTLFDVASRAEILGFARVLHESEALDEGALAKRLNLRQVNMVAVAALRQRLWQQLWRNYDLAQKSCEQDASFCYVIEHLGDLRQQAEKFEVAADSFYTAWAGPARVFHQRYLDEQLRKAALFPQTSSEIERFSDQERNGDGLNDRLFMLTFEGGPGPATDALTDYLRRQKLDATFFVLGNGIQARRDKSSINDLRALYQGQCVGILGWEYRSHAHWQQWQESVMRSAARVQGDLPEQYVPLFRPPYGQRRADSQGFFASQHLQVALWDIESQDQSALTAEQSAQRVLSLMLLWRHGVIQFHDNQPKAQAAVAWLLKNTAQSGIGWEDCKAYAARQQ
ncbi:polysaccharide deacetylase family protein [Pseudomonas fontis]|uniref:Polysaccharide deacetylase family protein n=1 Tax=Pseudomonas fontis TaxID=2942633 RepID=A0ABT5P0Z8_9PSED|nr:polysaccharide deacetylase family protein [Pseudomonas fontis]MDD0972694.1 polysaccharide deacetylase family protein [Pseudomonas fontis]MDD0994133.1 polysaccharide deacetylase family protein [Pseudomonas fontis]